MAEREMIEITSDDCSDCPPHVNSTCLANPEGSEMAEREREIEITSDDHRRDCPSTHVDNICLTTNPDICPANPEGSEMAEREVEMITGDHYRDCPPPHDVNHICLANPEGSEMAEREREITSDRHRDCPPHVSHICLANPEGPPNLPLPERPFHSSTEEESQESNEMHILQIRERFFKVPATHRRANEDAFDPCFFSFGPYHAGAARLSDGEQWKCLVARDVIGSDGLERLVRRIQEDESRLRDVYVPMSEAQHAGLAKLLAVDSIFLVYAALRNGRSRRGAFTTHESRRDALLLESQIPTFVLKYALESLGCDESLADVLKYYYKLGASLSPFQKGDEPSLQETRAVSNDEASLLGHVYDYLTETGGSSDATENHEEEEEDDSQHLLVRLPTASQLAESGLRLRACNSRFCGVESTERPWELRLPRINVGDNKLCFLCNLLAYEATTREAPFQPVSSYIAVMNQLVDTEKDWQVLVDAGVITNLAGGHLELASSWIKRLNTPVPGFLTAADRAAIMRVQAVLARRQRQWWRVALKNTGRFLASDPSLNALQKKLASLFRLIFFISVFDVLFLVFFFKFFKASDQWPH